MFDVFVATWVNQRHHKTQPKVRDDSLVALVAYNNSNEEYKT